MGKTDSFGYLLRIEKLKEAFQKHITSEVCFHQSNWHVLQQERGYTHDWRISTKRLTLHFPLLQQSVIHT